VGLETTFSYSGGKVSAITDPAGRITKLEYDSAGNLTRIEDPDGSARTWEYDSEHHIIAELDKRNSREETFYDFAGRALSATQKDRKSLKVAPVQVGGLYRPEETIDPFNAPVVFALGDVESSLC
jgi:YD repeat-containing protein